MPKLEGTVPFRAGGYAPRHIGWASSATLIGLLVFWQILV